MAKRNLLAQHLTAAWDETINHPYASGLINSERGLQFYFCIALLKKFSGKVKRRLFVEPTVQVEGELRIPDLVICNSRNVIGVVEFKYTPRGVPREYPKDFETLALIDKNSAAQGLTVSNQRYRGPESPRVYEVAPDAVYCWASIHSDECPEFDRAKLETIGGRYLELLAITSPTSVRIATRRGFSGTQNWLPTKSDT